MSLVTAAKGELRHRIRRFYRWEKREARDILISILAITFIFGYSDSGESFQLGTWLLNMLITLFIVALSFLAYDAGMKLAALNQGLRAEYRMWPQGLAIGVIITLLTQGRWYVILAGGLFVHHVSILRIGKWRYGLNTIAQGTVAAAGPIANFVLMTISLVFGKQLGIAPDFFIFAAKINGFMMAYQLLPIPKLNGIHIFFMSRLAYAFIFGALVSYLLLIFIGIYSWILAFLIGVVSWFSWYWWVEGGKG